MSKHTEKQRTVLINGCSRGIGYENALLFARNGYKVIATVRCKKNASYITKDQKKYPSLDVIELNLSKESSFNKVVENIKKIILLSM